MSTEPGQHEGLSSAGVAERLRRHGPPRSAAALLPSGRETALALIRGSALTAGVLALFLGSLPDEPNGRTLAVTALVIGQTLLVLTARAGEDLVWRAHWRNPLLLPILALSVVSVAAIPLVPPLADVLRMRPLDVEGWAIASVVSAATVLGPEVLKLARPRRVPAS